MTEEDPTQSWSLDTGIEKWVEYKRKKNKLQLFRAYRAINRINNPSWLSCQLWDRASSSVFFTNNLSFHLETRHMNYKVHRNDNNTLTI